MVVLGSTAPRCRQLRFPCPCLSPSTSKSGSSSQVGARAKLRHTERGFAAAKSLGVHGVKVGAHLEGLLLETAPALSELFPFPRKNHREGALLWLWVSSSLLLPSP